MRSLVITEIGPCAPGCETTGLARRFSMFVRAIGSISAEVELLHLVPQQFVGERDAEGLSREGSAYFGFPVRANVIGHPTREKTFWTHYVAGLFSISGQPEYHGYAGEPQVQAVSRALAGAPDLVFVHGLRAMSAVLRGHGRPARLFFDLVDVEHEARLRSAFHPPFWPGKLFYAGHAVAIAAAERKAAAIARATFTCSDLDRDRLARIGIRSRVTVIPNAVPLPDRVEPVAGEPTLMFIGNYHYPPNKHAAERLVRRIWPLVRSRRPDARLLMAGLAIEVLPGFDAPEAGVEYVGFVPELGELYARARVVCCPITLGGGTRVKLVEAAAFAKPIVSTRIGAEGLAFVDGAEILIRDDDCGFAAACVGLLEDDARCRSLGLAAQSRMRSQYDVAAVQSRIAGLMAAAS